MANRIPEAKLFTVAEKLPVGMPAVQEQPDVTVVTVVFNAVKSGRKKPFVRCLDSVQTQRGCRLEHLIVDGGSRDGTVELVEKFANSAVPIRYVSQPDRGIYEAMNRGLALARGKYVVFLNSDDRFCSPDGMAESVKALEASGADYSYAPAHVVDEDGNEVAHDFSEADESRTLFCGMTICHQTILIRRDVLLAVDGFDLSYRSAADYDLFLRIVYAGYRGVRVAENFVAFLSGGFSSVNATLSEKEVDAIFRTRIRENFGVDFSDRAMRCMRMTQEYPTDLTAKMLPVGERSFQRPLRTACVESPEWEKGVKWRFDRALPNAVWQHYEWPWLPAGFLRQAAHALVFSCRHPLHAFGALKSWLLHLRHGYQPLHEWFVVRCILIAERKFDTFRVAYPYDAAVKDDALRKSARGLMCTDAVRVPVPCLAGGGFAYLFVLLYACAYQEGMATAEVRIDGRLLGKVLLRPAEMKVARWSSFRLPPGLAAAANAELEIHLACGGEFVFGGLCLCPSL